MYSSREKTDDAVTLETFYIAVSNHDLAIPYRG
jgi:hypothetical protein